MLKFIKTILIIIATSFVLVVAALAVTIGYTEHRTNEAIEACELEDGTVTDTCMYNHLNK